MLKVRLADVAFCFTVADSSDGAVWKAVSGTV